MPVTNDDFPGPNIAEELRLEERDSDPSAEGAIRNVLGDIKVMDRYGVFNLRLSLVPNEVGQMIYSYDGSTFEIVEPLVSDKGFILTSNDGHALVVE